MNQSQHDPDVIDVSGTPIEEQETTGASNSESVGDAAADCREIAGAFARVGAAWARYGLGVARLSVEASARTLDVTAAALGALARGFADLEQRGHTPKNAAAAEEPR